MKQDGEQDTKSSENRSIEETNHVTDSPPCTSTDVTNSVEEEEDEFGDFETAFVDEAEPSVDIAPQDSRKSSQDIIHFPPLSNFFNDDDVWEVAVSQNESSFDQIDLGYFLDGSSCEMELPSVSLWNVLNVIEETNSLKFRWPSSNISTVFLQSIEVFEPNISSMKNTDCSTPSSQSRPLFAENPLMDMGTVDLSSLQVEPADFDWSRAGLVNPLRVSSSDQAPNLNCDFFQNSPIKMNGKTLLDDDLAAWGLDSEQVKPTTTENGHSHSNNNGLSFLSVDELSEDAKRLLERLPNLDFMLADRITRLK